MTSTKISGWIEKGKLFLSNRLRMVEDLSNFPDCDVLIIIKKKGKRSSQANRYYWGVIIKEATIRMKQLGNNVTEDDMHEGFKRIFNPAMHVNAHGVLIEGFGSSTTELNKEEFFEYCDNIRKWCFEWLDIDVPEPNTQVKMFNY